MKTYIKITVILVLIATLLASCGKEFLNTKQTDRIDDNQAFRNPGDLVAAMHGVYHATTRLGFMGRNAVVIPDVAADKLNKAAASDLTLVPIEQFSFTTTDVGFGGTNGVWPAAYRVVNFSQRIIQEGTAMLSKFPDTADQKTIHTQLAEAYAMRAFALFKLVNFFGLPYSDANRNTPGVIAENAFVFTDAIVSRATVGETYDLIVSHINNAKTHYVNGDQTHRPFYMNYGAVLAFEARVNLYMKNYSGAITAANAALNISKAAIETDSLTYAAMWGQPTTNRENIFSLFTDNINWLQASSLATYYNTYGGSANTSFVSSFKTGDMRLGLFARHTTANADFWRPMKYPNATSINNIRVFSAPEMYLILAEAHAELDQPDQARTALLHVSRRDPAITTVAHLPSGKDDLIAFIAEERAKELFQEGHRMFDIRRTGQIMSRPGPPETRMAISNWDASKFVYPIPESEFTVPGTKVKQTPNWYSFLPR
jgi:tetratricopeptide (TPR) repeat protein